VAMKLTIIFSCLEPCSIPDPPQPRRNLGAPSSRHCHVDGNAKSEVSDILFLDWTGLARDIWQAEGLRIRIRKKADIDFAASMLLLPFFLLESLPPRSVWLQSGVWRRKQGSLPYHSNSRTQSSWHRRAFT
jgi:hypothetical protein